MKKKISLSILSIVIAASVILNGCSKNQENATESIQTQQAVEDANEQSDESTEGSEETTNEESQNEETTYQYLTVNEDGTRSFEDMAGRTVTIPDEIEVALQVWPGCVPTINLLGVGAFFPAYMDGMKEDTYYWTQKCNPYVLSNEVLDSSVEGILTYNPDIVFVKSEEDAQTYENAGITAAVMHAASSEDGLRSIRIMAEIFGEEAIKRCDAYMEYYDEKLSVIQERIADIDESEWPSVFYVNTQGGDNPLVTSAKGTVQESYGKLVGFTVPAVEIAEGDRKEITSEQLLNMQPDYIVIFGTNSYAAFDNLMNDPVLSELEAVKNSNLLIAPRGNQPMSGTGVENILFLQWAAATLHPDLFSDFDLHTIVKEFYTDFMGYAISDENVDYMLAGKNKPDEE